MPARTGTPWRALLAAGLLSLSPPPLATAAEPTLGGLLAPAPITVGRDHTITVENRSTITADVILATTDAAYVVSPGVLTLDVGERATVAIVATGTEPASLTATYRPHDPLPGVTGSVVLQADFRQPGPFDALPSWWWLLLLIPCGLVLAATRRYRRVRQRTAIAP